MTISPLPLMTRSSGKAGVRVNAVATTLFIIMLVAGALLTYLLIHLQVSLTWTVVAAVAFFLLAFYLFYAVKMANQWEKAVVLRFGKLRGLFGPGIFWIIPIADQVVEWIDSRVMVSPFSAEKTLTKDTVPVNVDAVLFWMVWDAEKAAMEVENYRSAISWAAQTALREVIGSLTLADILVGRAMMDHDLQRIIDERTTPWGITVQFGRNPRCGHSKRSGRHHEPPGAGRA